MVGDRKERRGTWIDLYFSKLGLPTPCAGGLSGLVLFVAGFIISVSYRFQHEYLHTWIFYIGAFGVAWVTASIRWGMGRMPVYFMGIRSCFLVEDDHYTLLLDRTLHAMWSGSGAFLFSITIAAVAWIVAYAGIFGLRHPVDLNSSHLFPLAWYQGNRLMNLIIIDLYGLVCSFPLGTGLWLLLQNAILFRRLTRLPTIPLPSVLLARFRDITNFYLCVSSSWFVGVALFGLLFFKHLDVIAALTLIITGGFGMLTFFLPQLVFHGFLTRAEGRIAEQVALLLREESGSNIAARGICMPTFSVDPSALEKLANMVQLTQPMRMWVYSFKDMLVLVLGQLFTLLPLALKPFLGGFLGGLK